MPLYILLLDFSAGQCLFLFFHQSQVVSSEGKSDVLISSKLWYANESRAGTMDHNWHVHINTVHNEDCLSTSGHYNPFNVDVGAAVSFPETT